MSLSYDHSKNAMAIATLKNPDGSPKKLVYFDPKKKVDEITADMITDEHLLRYFGRNAVYRGPAERERHVEKLVDRLNKASGKEKRAINQLKAEGDDSFFPLPMHNGEERDTWFVTGMSGSGKSYFTREMLRYYKKLGVDNIFVVTTVEDENYLEAGAMSFVDPDDLLELDSKDDYQKQLKRYQEAKIKFKHKKKEMKDHPDLVMKLELEIEELKPDPGLKTKKVNYKKTELYEKMTSKPSVFVYDDWESYPKGKRDKCRYLIENQLTTGRHKHINMMVLNHQSTFGHESRTILNESMNYTIFNRNMFKSYSYLLKTYLGMDTLLIKQVRELLKTSRSVTINRLNRWIITEEIVMLY